MKYKNLKLMKNRRLIAHGEEARTHLQLAMHVVMVLLSGHLSLSSITLNNG